MLNLIYGLGGTYMETMDILQKAITYIEENLKADISVEELAKLSGFSTYHLYHIFGVYMGMPVAAYITKRRLQHAIYEAQSGEKIISLALAYGFNTHAGFYKAFKRAYGCSPKKYLKIKSAKQPVLINLKGEGKIMLTQSQVRKILSNWNIDLTLEINREEGAAKINHTWCVGNKYLLKTGKNISGLRTHISILKALAANGMEDGGLIKTNNKEDFLVVEDRFYVLFNRIEGNPLKAEEIYRGNRKGIGNKYGEAIGKLHQVLEKETDNIEVNNNNIYHTVINWALPETKGMMEQWGVPLPKKFFEDYISSFKELYPDLPRHLIHRDANPSNIIWNNGEVNGFIDFEISEESIRIFDPCYCATGILSEAESIEDGFEKWPELLGGIIEGYDNICGLTETERKAIPYVIYSIQMIFIAWLGNREEFKSLAMKNRRILLWIWENKDRCFSKL